MRWRHHAKPRIEKHVDIIEIAVERMGTFDTEPTADLSFGFATLNKGGQIAFIFDDDEAAVRGGGVFVQLFRLIESPLCQAKKIFEWLPLGQSQQKDIVGGVVVTLDIQAARCLCHNRERLERNVAAQQLWHIDVGHRRVVV